MGRHGSNHYAHCMYTWIHCPKCWCFKIFSNLEGDFAEISVTKSFISHFFHILSIQLVYVLYIHLQIRDKIHHWELFVPHMLHTSMYIPGSHPIMKMHNRSLYKLYIRWLCVTYRATSTMSIVRPLFWAGEPVTWHERLVTWRQRFSDNKSHD